MFDQRPSYFRFFAICLLVSISTFSSISFAFTPYVKIHVTSVKTPLDWSTPTSLAKTIFANYSMTQFFATGLVGHVFMEYQCSEKRDPELIGKDFADMNQVTNDILNRELAYSIFFKDYAGKIEGNKELKEFLENVRTYKIPSHEIVYSISVQQCHKIAFAAKQARNTKKITYRLSGGIGPKGECSSFVLSLLKNANIKELDKMIAQWTKTLFIPKKMLGSEGKKISHTHFLDNDLKWGDEKDKDVIEFQIIEPETIINWIKSKTSGKTTIELKG